MFEVGDDVVAALVGILERVRDLRGRVHSASAWGGGTRREFLVHLDALATAIGLVRGPVMLAERDAGTSQRVGDRSFESAVGRSSGKGFVEARREVRQAETLASMPSVAGAVELGGMTLAHVDAIAKVVSGATGSSGARALETGAGQAALVELARGRDAGEFQREVARYVAAQDPAAHERDHATQRAERFLVLSDQATGTFLKGRLDRFAGERLRLALEATGCEPNDDRDRPQAMADALTLLVDSALSGSGSGSGPRVSGAQNRPHVSLLLREDTYAAILADQRARAERGTAAPPSRGTAGDVSKRVAGSTAMSAAPPIDSNRVASTTADAQATTPAPAALTESGLPMARSEVARILCDATVARIVVDAHDVPLNVGRDQRLYSGAQRRAVIVRDKQCAWPGCGIPARWAEVHHIRWWARDDGETSVENGVLLCEHHHHLVHQHDLDIRRRQPDDACRPGHRASEAPTAAGPGVRYTFRTRSGRVVAPTVDSVGASCFAPTATGSAGDAISASGSRASVDPVGASPRAGGRPGPARQAAAGPATRTATGSATRPAPSPRRPVQPSFLDELIAAQPPDPPF